MGGLFPTSYEMAFFTIWLLGGVGVGALSGMVTSLIAKRRRGSSAFAFLSGFASAGIVLIIFSPGDGFWSLWEIFGALVAAAVAVIVAVLVSSFNRIRRATKARQ